MKGIKKLRSSSLVVTVVIALVLSILCSSLILLAYYNRQNRQKAEIEYRLGKNATSAINLVLTDSVIHCDIYADSLDLFMEGKDSVLISKKQWGVFQVSNIKAFYGRFSKQLAFFYGPSLPDSLNGCLYLANHQRSLILAGNTKLFGDAYLSKAGLKAGYIDQRGFSYDKLIEGEIKESNKTLPGLDETIVNNINNLLDIYSDTVRIKKMEQGLERGAFQIAAAKPTPVQIFFIRNVFTPPGRGGNNLNFEKVNTKSFTTIWNAPLESDSVSRSFEDEPLLIFKKGKAILESCILNGQIIIFSDSILEVNPTAKLKDVILVAPAIIIKEGFHGTIQAIASDSLIVEDNCIFDYPSSFFLQKRKLESLPNRMIIGKGCHVTGMIVSLCSPTDFYKSYIEMGVNTIVEGVIYTMGYLNLGANVSGTVLTDYFIYKTPSTIYENYLVDIEIDRGKLSGFFIASPLFSGGERRKIIQWVN